MTAMTNVMTNESEFMTQALLWIDVEVEGGDV